jgi:hypothetical protein
VQSDVCVLLGAAESSIQPSLVSLSTQPCSQKAAVIAYFTCVSSPKLGSIIKEKLCKCQMNKYAKSRRPPWETLSWETEGKAAFRQKQPRGHSTDLRHPALAGNRLLVVGEACGESSGT